MKNALSIAIACLLPLSVYSEEVVSTNKTPSVGVSEIIKLSESDVSIGIITNYIAKSTVQYSLTVSDILLLKSKSVSDVAVLAMMQRGNTVKKQSADKGPESEDFWWKHYGYPRVLKNSPK